MQQEFEATLIEFLAKAKVHFEVQNASLDDYAHLLGQAQEQFLDYQAFVDAVVDSLEVIQKQQVEVASKQVEVAEVSPEVIAPKKRILSMSPKFESIDPKTVLIVDQAELNRVLLGRFFKSLPVTLEFASSGEQALGKMGNQRFDLVLMDLQLKGMSGLEAIKTIRNAQSDAGKKITIIAIASNDASDDDKKQVIDGGADECINKGMPRDAFRDKVLDLLINASSPSA
jgi:CheY-like chemotaxis protein